METIGNIFNRLVPYTGRATNYQSIDESPELRSESKRNRLLFAAIAFSVFLLILSFLAFIPDGNKLDLVFADGPIQAIQGDFREATLPYSIVDPRTLSVQQVDRTPESKPSEIFAGLRDVNYPLPTNSWCQNFLLGYGNKTNQANKVFVLPYIIEAFHFFQGVRTHPVRIMANDRTVLMIEEEDNGMALGAVESFLPHEVASDKTLAVGRLSIVLQWKSKMFKKAKTGSMMYTPIVRGSPYISMVYSDATPRVYVQRSISHDLVVDNNESGPRLKCGSGYGIFSENPILVQRELKVQFEVSDMTWIIFVSEPTEFVCSNLYLSTSVKIDDGNAVRAAPGPGSQKTEPHFDLRAVRPMKKGMIRIAMVNNCTTGFHHSQLCERDGKARDNTEFTNLIRKHSNVYASGLADIQFVFPPNPQEEDVLKLEFDWAPNLMSRVHLLAPDQYVEVGAAVGNSLDGAELLLYAIPHHQERMTPVAESSNKVLSLGCTPTLHGTACPVLGRRWALVEHLHRVSFYAPRAPRQEMLDAILKAVDDDIDYALPVNYMRGAGDTYFSGKMLAKLARVLLIAEEVGYTGDLGAHDAKFDAALGRLRAATEIWLNSTAESPLLYDRSWGGLVMCGCNYNGDDGGHCYNRFPDCPALVDQGQNFGAGFYNDHHFHFGYHIYAAAVLSRFDYVWAKKYYEHVLLFVRDIANPSPQDPYFPTWRHKDWYLGFSWASGIVTTRGLPYPNGRNQESVSESINAYEAIALYGDVMTNVFEGSRAPLDVKNRRIAERINDMGRLLYATETRSAKIYWHVQAPGEGVARIYPEIYTPKVVGMLWSLLAQQQTWFGNEPYKSYGIQLMPVTAGTELRDPPDWVAEMLPFFQESCDAYPGCVNDGWSILIHICQATAGDWFKAWENVERLPDEVYLTAGGNGHSKSNTLWYIATRPSEIEI